MTWCVCRGGGGGGGKRGGCGDGDGVGCGRCSKNHPLYLFFKSGWKTRTQCFLPQRMAIEINACRTRVILPAHVEDLSAVGNQTRVGGVGVLGKIHSVLFFCPLTFVGARAGGGGD